MGQLFSAHSGVPEPAEQSGSAKKKDRHSLTIFAHSDKACFYEGVPFRGDQQAPG